MSAFKNTLAVQPMASSATGKEICKKWEHNNYSVTWPIVLIEGYHFVELDNMISTDKIS